MHIGNADWVLIDSCLEPNSGRAACLQYLEGLGVQVAKQVKLVVITHWDDDHIRGMSQVVATCEAARVACSAAINRKEVIQFVVEQDSQRGAIGSGLDELRDVLRTCVQRKTGIIWARANLPLHPLPPGNLATVVALSPSDDSVQRSITSLAERATGGKRVARGRYMAPEGPNGASIAVAIRTLGSSIMLGADLEVSKNSEAGWDAVLTYAKPAEQASLVKVPHHGSPGAHHDAYWAECIRSDAIAIVAPWSNGGNFIPKDEDLQRLKAASGRLFVTASPGLRRVAQNSAARSLMRKLHGTKELLEFANWGHVRARCLDGETWTVEVEADAVEVK